MQNMSVLDLFSIGPGPSSSHTVGPMRAAFQFSQEINTAVDAVEIDLYGSLALTGKAHGTELGLFMGLEGHLPEDLDIVKARQRLQEILETQKMSINDQNKIVSFKLNWNRRATLPEHSNGIRFQAFQDNETIHEAVFFSVGGGFIVRRGDIEKEETGYSAFRFRTGEQLLNLCQLHSMSIADVMLHNESVFRSHEETHTELLNRWSAMKRAVEAGMKTEGELPGGLKVKRRAASLKKNLNLLYSDIFDRVNMYALAVSEENAAGGMVVTAPTNGAAGIIPAVLYEYVHSHKNCTDDDIVRFLLTCGAIGLLYKWNASISGAEVGCQGEIGVACSMAAAGLAALFGGSPEQIENAAEIGMEHNLGLTCDPVGGLVQVPCIERNAMGAIKAINAAKLALREDGNHVVSLDQVIATMHQTGADMKTRYKETSRGGLAVNVSLPEC